MVTWLYYCVKGLLSASTYVEICRIVDHSTYPCEDNSLHGLYSRFLLFTSDPFSPPHIRVSCRWSISGFIFCLFIYGRASLPMEGKSVVSMEITFMDNGGNIFVLYRNRTLGIRQEQKGRPDRWPSCQTSKLRKRKTFLFHHDTLKEGGARWKQQKLWLVTAVVPTTNW